MKSKRKESPYQPFMLSDIDDVRIIISVKGKHFGIVANKQKCEERKIDAKQLRIALLHAMLEVHDIVTPALEDIKEKQI